MITRFNGPWVKLSNYSICSIMFEGHFYQSVEHAYQAYKTTDPLLQKAVRDCATPATAKKLARTYHRREDWDAIKVDLMRKLLRLKFCQEPERSILLSTSGQKLVEGNMWHDNFWGNCACEKCGGTIGHNNLGKLLMETRTWLTQVDLFSEPL